MITRGEWVTLYQPAKICQMPVKTMRSFEQIFLLPVTPVARVFLMFFYRFHTLLIITYRTVRDHIEQLSVQSMCK